jgi:putative NIF3 family GTP cyclohydrolase 1 type 2
MNIDRFYRKAVEAGIAADLRGRKEMDRLLAEAAEEFEKAGKDEKKYFDRDRLFNPYADSRLLWGDPKAEVRRILVGIDIDGGELHLAHALNREAPNRKIDLVLGHHPMGSALYQMHDVMRLQADVLALHGVTIGVAEQLMDKRIDEIERRLLPANATRTVDLARVLELPLMCLHTAADNCVASYLTKLFAVKKPARLKDLVKILRGIPEYEKSVRLQAPPKIISGKEGSSCGKIFVDMTGGTEGSKDVLDRLASGGVSTIVGMHMSEDHLSAARKAGLNVVIAGHIPSDVLGLNLLLDEVEKGGRLDFVCVSGFERFRRGKNRKPITR